MKAPARWSVLPAAAIVALMALVPAAGRAAPEARERNRVSRISHPTAGAVPNIETPLNMGLTPTIDPVAAPLLGQHTREVLRKTLGYDDARIDALAEAGVFGISRRIGQVAS